MQIATVKLERMAVYAAAFCDALKTGSANIGNTSVAFPNGVMPICSERADHVTFAWASGVRVQSGSYSLDLRSVTAYADRLAIALDLSGVVSKASSKPSHDTLELRSAAAIANTILQAVKSKRVQLSPQAAMLFVREVIPKVTPAGEYFELDWTSGVYVEIPNIPDPLVKGIRVYRDRWEVLLPLRMSVGVEFT
jgi:hypothetical protein